MIAWHYTTGEKYELIKLTGALMPADIGVEPPEQGIIWFSTHPYFENSACKGLADSNGMLWRTATVREMYDLGKGMVRFECPVSRLKYGENLRKAAKMKLGTWRRLVKQAKIMKADPGDWWGSTEDFMRLDDLKVEIMDESLKWRPL